MQNIIEKVQNRLWIFPALALLALFVGRLCTTSCVFLHGDILGIDLEILGTVFYSMLLFSVVFHNKFYPKNWVMKIISAAVCIGIGVEFILVKFQIQNSTYCPRCLISAFFLIMMFIAVVQHVKKWIVVLLILLSGFLTFIAFNGSVIPSYAQKFELPVFGNEKSQTEIIIYSDYFCPGCRKIDDQINDILRKKKDKIKVHFVDVSLHAGSLEYAEIFLYTCFGSGKDLERAIKVREILFHAAETKTDQRAVFNILNSQKISFKEDKDDARGIFRSFYNPSIQKDKINSTPTLVIVKGNDRKTYVGGSKILKALEEISSL